MKTFDQKRIATYKDLLDWLSSMPKKQLDKPVVIFDWDGGNDRHAQRKELNVIMNKKETEFDSVVCLGDIEEDNPIIGIDDLLEENFQL